VELFEASGEANLWALTRQQRASIVNWLGEEGYQALESKSKVVVDKTMKAMRSQAQQDLIEAKWYHAVVIREIKQRAIEQGLYEDRMPNNTQ
jgi:hypothetical protein